MKRSINKIKLICACGKEFEVFPSRINSGRKNCSKECGVKYRKTIPKRVDSFKSCLNCGVEFVVNMSNLKRGFSKYCSIKCSVESFKNNPEYLKKSSDKMKEYLKENKREKHPRYKGGIGEDQGYITIYTPDHPNARSNKMLEHRLVMERHLGRLLEKHEHVHHIDGNKKNNTIENLQLVRSQREHITLHMLEKHGGEPSTTGWSTIWNECVECGKRDAKHIGKGLCKKCYNKQWKHDKKRKLQGLLAQSTLEKSKG